MKHPQYAQRGNAAVLVIVGVLVVALAGLVGWRLYRQHHNIEATTTSPTSQQSTLATSGDSNSDLTADLNNAETTVSQGGQNLSAADTALNDSQNQVTVPTE